MEKEFNKDCKCKRKCIRHGNCIECQKYHLSIKSPTNCMRKKKEKPKGDI